MNFDEFFLLLKSILDKSESGVQPSNENFSLYLATRYLSFYHPGLCDLLNESVNKFKINSKFATPEDGFNFLKALLPKLKYKHIKYIKKQAVKNQRDKNISDETVTKLANYLEISRREVRHLLEL
jgi:hypothetical protein